MKVELVAVSAVDQVWPLCATGLQQACERVATSGGTPWTAGDLWRDCRSGRAFLFIAYEPDTLAVHMATAWRFEHQDGRYVFRCLMLWGDQMSIWLPTAFGLISQAAKQNGATHLVAAGRLGWLRRIPNTIRNGDDMELNLNG